MGDHSKISWTSATWNPISGCSKVSPGCAHCYAEALSQRFGWTSKPWTAPNAATNVQLRPERLDQPTHWRRPRKIFVNSMSDLFHEQVPDSFLDRIFAVMAATPRHTYQILTKRPRRMRAYLTDPATPEHIVLQAWHNAGMATHRASLHDIMVRLNFSWPLPHVWLGVSAEDQRRADERIPVLLQTPAAVRFLSAEPLLGPLDLTTIHDETVLDPKCWGDCACDTLYGYDPGCVRHGGDGDLTRKLNWVIVGAESGPSARPMDDDWVRALRDQCRAAAVPFFFKQRCDHGRKDPHPLLDGRLWQQYPDSP